ncbi:hypothetical protein PR202_gb29851 [Eleusine coracana subsp. coracana]|uniref:Uncharacterized protein n=1 Tax=Eleusine coracana subsp. coracana TaxID=191504 RepID=A0AAV5G040_ELECO|nr:hypothetical protein PR202_gb29851 [Eleusine coracana subsp. coracana]
MAAITCVSRFKESKICSVSSMSWINLLTRTRHGSEGRKEENITKLVVRELNNLEALSGREAAVPGKSSYLCNCRRINGCPSPLTMRPRLLKRLAKRT